MRRKEKGLHVDSASGERVEQREVGEVTHRVTCTWWLLWLVVEIPWWSNSCLSCANELSLEKTLLSTCRVFIPGSEGNFGSERVLAGRVC